MAALAATWRRRHCDCRSCWRCERRQRVRTVRSRHSAAMSRAGTCSSGSSCARCCKRGGRFRCARTHAHGLRVAVARQLLPGGQHQHRPYRYVWPRQHGFIADPLCAGPLSHVLCALLAAGNRPLATASAMGGPGWPDGAAGRVRRRPPARCGRTAGSGAQDGRVPRRRQPVVAAGHGPAVGTRARQLWPPPLCPAVRLTGASPTEATGWLTSCA